MQSVPFTYKVLSFIQLMATELPHVPQVKPTHFFKIIHSHSQSLLEGKLMIPRKLVEKYGEGLPETISLKPPNGTTWKLKLVKNGGKIWFQKGWKEFAEYHSLSHGHLLVFRYKGTSQFKVHIFDKSALEIKYPFKRVEAKRASYGQGYKCPNDENLEDFRTSQKRKGKQTITAKNITAIDRARSFKTCNPSFILVMHSSCVIGYGPLNFPKKFVKRHLDLVEKRGDIHLRVLNGNVWPARYQIRIANTRPRFELKKGWKAFVKNNNLKVGDVCTFELILKNELTFQVHIFREIDSPNCSTSQKSSKMRAATQGPTKRMKVITSGKQIITAKEVTTLDKAKSLETCNPSFHVAMHPSCVKAPRHLNLANEFGKRHLDLDKKLGDQEMFGLGCSNFADKQSIDAKEITTLERASSLETCDPSFHIVMHPSYVEAPYQLRLPSKFSKRHLDLGKKDGDIHLKVSNGRVWGTKYVIRKENRRTRFVLSGSGGWKAFVKDHELKVGDICTFELIHGTQFTFQVHIFRDSFGKQTIQLVQHLKNLPKGEKLLLQDIERE